ncbi:hypothetical protein EDC04DRAFT_2604803 [Pisolithus marmoratus]|nr:hypothetical protein EDC04DRAFT_2604803 [Pisolithus marmoratus]
MSIFGWDMGKSKFTSGVSVCCHTVGAGHHIPRVRVFLQVQGCLTTQQTSTWLSRAGQKWAVPHVLQICLARLVPEPNALPNFPSTVQDSTECHCLKFTVIAISTLSMHYLGIASRPKDYIWDDGLIISGSHFKHMSSSTQDYRRLSIYVHAAAHAAVSLHIDDLGISMSNPWVPLPAASGRGHWGHQTEPESRNRLEAGTFRHQYPNELAWG